MRYTNSCVCVCMCVSVVCVVCCVRCRGAYVEVQGQLCDIGSRLLLFGSSRDLIQASNLS